LHHGLPMVDEVSDRPHRSFATRFEQLCEFIAMLVGNSECDPRRLRPALYDTIVVLTLTTPSARHPDLGPDAPAVNQLVANIRDSITKLLGRCRSAATQVPLDGGARPVGSLFLTRKDLSNAAFTRQSAAHEVASASIAAKMHAYGGGREQKHVNLLIDAAALRTKLRAATNATDPDEQGSLALLCLLCLFRRPRPIPIMRSLLARWLFDPGDLEAPLVMTAALESLDRTLDKLCNERACEWCEGGHIWVPRSIHENVYSFVTSGLRLRKLPESVRTDDGWTATVVGALMAGTWHLQAARVYFSDAYLSSHDEQAFFEYLYHRVSGLRYLAILQAALGPGAHYRMVGKRLRAIDDELKKWHGRRIPAFRRADYVGGQKASDVIPDNALALSELLAQECPHLATLLLEFGAFSSVRRDQSLHHELEKARAAGGVERKSRELLNLAVHATRRHGIQALYNAFVREQRRISATTIPDAWLGWIDRIVAVEIAEIAGQWSMLKTNGRIPMTFGLADLTEPSTVQPSESVTRCCGVLGRELTQLKLRLLRGKLDYGTCAKTAAREIRAIVTATDDAALGDGVSASRWDLRDDSAIKSAWQRSESLFGSKEGDNDDKSYLLRTWCEFARAAGGRGEETLTRSVLTSLKRLVRSPEQRSLVGSRRRMRRMTHEVLKVDADWMLHKELAMWRYFDDAPWSTMMWRGRDEHLRSVEHGTHETEDVVRMNAESAIEYALGRSHSLSIRGRALYLRNQFREAHRVLTLSLSDVGDHLDHDRFARAITHLFRAELLTISADVHLWRTGDVSSSLRKVETAIDMLDAAERWLYPAANRPMWWLHLHIGRAQVRHEQLLLEVRRLAEGKSALSGTFAQRSLWLEQCVLDALRALRLALDTLPVVQMQRPERPRPLVRLEDKVLALWVQLFVAAFSYNHLLLTRMQIALLGGRQSMPSRWSDYYVQTGKLIDNVRPLAELVRPHGFWKSKWRAWCSLRQFYHFADDPCEIADVVEDAFKGGGKGTESVALVSRSRTFREELLEIENWLIGTKRVQERLWLERRNTKASGDINRGSGI
jgi:hypothetical protein